ncbi:HIRA-interacting protein 3 isoform X2 [Brachyhypopomus gauderio]|uniref:HIRA-interacting protein 3 isoform X2 n=1 Tax=Brachyhypopomus gauderio TaxID=698409 RepID=UPI004042216E
MGSEKDDIRKFVFGELHDCSDLSTLTIRILRRRYLEHVGKESLSEEHKQLLKRIVEEELLKMQDNGDEECLDTSAEPLQKQNKRKREEDKDETEEQNEDDVVARKKKSRFESAPPDSPDSGIEKAAHEEPQKDHEDDDDDGREGHDENDEEMTEKVETKKKVERKGRLSSESEEEHKPRQSGKVVDSEEEELDSFDDSGKEEENQQKTKSRGQRTKKVSSDGEGKANRGQSGPARAPESRREDDVKEPDSHESEAVRRVQKEVFGSSSESEEESEETAAKGKESDSGESDEEISKKKGGANASSDEEPKAKGKRDEDEDSHSDSSSLPSLEEEEQSKKPKQEVKKSGSKRKNSDESKAKGGKLDEEHKAVSRLKRYIALCGVRRNYKKLLDGCRSVKAKVAVLKKELEELGVEAKRLWKNLKDTYIRKKQREEMNLGRGQAAKRKRKWKFMDSMSFLEETAAYRRVCSILENEDCCEKTGWSGDGESEGETEEIPNSSISVLYNERKKRRKEQREQQRAKQCEDENTLFLLSLVPSLERLPVKKQSWVRLKIQELLHGVQIGPPYSEHQSFYSFIKCSGFQLADHAQRICEYVPIILLPLTSTVIHL